MRTTRRGLTSTDVVVLMLLVALAAFLLVPAVGRHEHTAHGVKCGNNLRQQAIAAIAYSDDKRFFPTLASQGGLAGGPESDHAVRVVETLIWYGYADTRESWVCPQSLDLFQPQRPNRAPGGQVPLFDPAPYPTLDQSTELSYGWTRRSLSSNARASMALAADRAVRHLSDEELARRSLPPGRIGNHRGGLTLVQVDGAVVWLSLGSAECGPQLVATDPTRAESGFLGIHDPSVPP